MSNAFDGKSMRDPIVRTTIDYHSPVIRHLEDRIWQKTSDDVPFLQPDVSYYIDVRPQGVMGPAVKFPPTHTRTRALTHPHTRTHTRSCCPRKPPRGSRLAPSRPNGFTRPSRSRISQNNCHPSLRFGGHRRAGGWSRGRRVVSLRFGTASPSTSRPSCKRTRAASDPWCGTGKRHGW